MIGVRRNRRYTSLVATLIMTAAAWLLAMGTAIAQPPPPPPPPAEPPGIWTGSTGAGMSLTNGNSDTVNYSLAFDITRDAKTRHVLKWTGLYLRGEREGELTVNRTSLGFRDQYAIRTRTFVYGQLDYLRDTFKLIDYLVAPTVGIGYKFIDTEATKFSADVGGGVVWEKNPDLDLQTDGAVTAGEKLQHQLTETTTLKHATTALWKADDFADGLYTVAVGVAVRMSQNLQLMVDLLDTFKNRPPTAATEKNDVALVVAVTLKY
jgi:putative salt-induced outer membrane protein YdiY